jgi:hypothetical protein
VVLDPNSPLASYGRVPASTGAFEWPQGLPWSPRKLTPQSPGCFGWGRLRLLDDPNLLAQNGPGAPAQTTVTLPLPEPTRGTLVNVPTTLHPGIVFARPPTALPLFQAPAKGQSAVPKPEDVIQGFVGNCPVAGTLMALAHSTKGQPKLAAMIGETQTTVTSKHPSTGATLTTDRLLTVTFPSGTGPVKITDYLYQSGSAPVVLLFMHSDQNPVGGVLWPSFLEKAYVLFKCAAGSESYQALDARNIQEVMNDFWGNHQYVSWDLTSAEILSQVTAGSCSSTGCTYGGAASFDLNKAPQKKQFHDKLKAFLTNHATLPTVAGTVASSGDIEGPHLYAVVGFAVNTVTVLNPNQNASNSPPRQVSLSFADFLDKFAFLAQGA